MKVGELREKLKVRSTDELIHLAVQFYKLVPKDKKISYGLDDLVDNPQKKKQVKRKPAVVLLPEDLALDINDFISDALDGLYIRPNQMIAKSERPKWRFKVKRWYKELIKTNGPDKNLALQAELLIKLYKMTCKACNQYYFPSEAPFASVGIPQDEFYKSILTLLFELDKEGFMNEGITLMVDAALGRDWRYADLMSVFISFLNIPDLKTMALEKTRALVVEHYYKPIKVKNRYKGSNSTEYKMLRKHNNLVELATRLSFSLYDDKEGIDYFHKHYYEKDKEVKIYCLVRIMGEYQLYELVLEQLKLAVKNKVKLRGSLVELLERLKDKA